MAYFDEALETAGGRQEIIPVRRRRELMQSWRHVYASRLHAATGKWTWLGYDWHVFSYRHACALDGDLALRIYVALPPPARNAKRRPAPIPSFKGIPAERPPYKRSNL